MFRKINVAEEEPFSTSLPPIFGQISQESEYLSKTNLTDNINTTRQKSPPLKKKTKKNRRYRRI